MMSLRCLLCNTHTHTQADVACRRHIFYLNHFVVLSRAAWELRHLPQCGIDCQINQEGEGKIRQGKGAEWQIEQRGEEL